MQARDPMVEVVLKLVEVEMLVVVSQYTKNFASLSSSAEPEDWSSVTLNREQFRSKLCPLS